MRIFIIFITILFTINPCNAAWFLQKKDYKQNFINDAQNAEKRNNIDSAFHIYEKALYYYKKDKYILESYAGFCERKKYFNKAQELYQKLYVLTKNPTYLFKKNVAEIKNGKLSKEQVQKLIKDRHLTSSQQNDINVSLIYYFANMGDWQSTKNSCDSIEKNDISKEVIDTCIAATVKTNDKASTYKYLLRYSKLYPQNTEIIKRISSLAGEYNDYQTEETFTKKFSALNPSDKGIKYRLAGIYQKHGDYKKANEVYENLIASGDKSKYVKDSYAYSLGMSKGGFTNKPPSFASKYIPKPLTPKELKEKAMYVALDNKDYAKVVSYLDELLSNSPKDTKLLKLRLDMALAQNDYPNAIIYFEKLKTLNYSLSLKDEKLLAFSYSKTDNYPKAIELIEQLLQKRPNDKDLLSLALEYSMAAKDWEKGLFYVEKLLAFEPTSEKLLKTQGDLYATIKDFPQAVQSYEQLVKHYPKLKYYMELANFYMANKEFVKAEAVLEPMYNSNLDNTSPESTKIIEVYLNSLLAQQKIMQAYCVIKTNHLENTKDGYMILGDIAMTNKDYECARVNFRNALIFDPESDILQNKLAQSYRMLKCLNTSEKIFNNVLSKDPCNLEARLGLGSLEIDKKNFENSRRVFCSILRENPDYRPAKIAIANSYIANDDNFAALETLENMPQDEEVKLMQDQTRYKMGIRPVVFKAIPDVPEMNVPLEDVSYESEINPNRALNGAVFEDRKELEYKKRRNEAITLVPTYSIFTQQLADQFRLNYIKGGINLSKIIDGNKLVFMGYNVIVYSSGSPQFLNNFVNEFRAGIQARPRDKWEYRADVGVKAFQFGDGAMLITDSWIKHYFNDKFNLKVGVMRNNIEQSYLSAVGERVDGVFTGRAADNKFYLEAQGKLPHQIYTYARGAYGIITAQNLVTNQYFEGYVGVGKLLYNNPKNKWINTFATDIVSYNSAYQYNLLNIYDSTGALFGGYFSPSYFNATTANLKLEGHFNKLPLRYGIKAFGGIQNALTPDQTTPTWGYSPYLSYAINDKISIYAAYNHFNFADVQRDQFIFSAVIRGFNNGEK